MRGVDISMDLQGRHCLDLVVLNPLDLVVSTSVRDLDDIVNLLDLRDSISVGDLGDDTFILPDQGVVPTCKCTSLNCYDPF